MSDQTKNKPFEKKTDRLDVRLSNQKKQDFSKACVDQGDTPSQAVRRFINSYIRRSKRDNLGASLRFEKKSKSLKYYGALTLCLLVFLFIGSFVNNTFQNMTKAKLFAFYDFDQSGLLELTEISPNDHHLHRILNIDGVSGISLDEFITKGTMTWEFINPDDWDIKTEKLGFFGLKGNIRKKSFKVKTPNFSKGTLIPTGNKDKPFLTLGEFKASGKNLNEIQENFNIDSRTINYETIGSFPTIKQYFVIFDLTSPKNFQIDVLEQIEKADYSKSIEYSRAVEWVNNNAVPFHVMGQGSKAWRKYQKNMPL